MKLYKHEQENHLCPVEWDGSHWKWTRPPTLDVKPFEHLLLLIEEDATVVDQIGRNRDDVKCEGCYVFFNLTLGNYGFLEEEGNLEDRPDFEKV